LRRKLTLFQDVLEALDDDEHVVNADTHQQERDDGVERREEQPNA
jgi:hypothetical protein